MIAIFLLTVVLTFSAGASAQGAAALDDIEREVIGAAIAQTLHPNSSGWILVDAQTAIFPCASAPRNIINFGNCSGMKPPDKSVDEVLTGIQNSMAGVDEETVTDLRNKSDNSVTLNRPFSLFVKQIFWRPGTPFATLADGSKPEFAVVVSRPGFDKNQGKALVYIGAVRWSEPELSFGDYIFLIKEDSAWTVKHSLRAWQLQKKE
ncbi:MAG TPA: hypothetical protein VGA27_05585 [Candidatus Binatia bacterium]